MIIEKSDPKFYYFGEYGAAFKHTFSALEALQHSIELITWKNLNELINLVFPGKFLTKDIETITGFNLSEEYRTGYGQIYENDFTKHLDSLGYKRLYGKSENFSKCIFGKMQIPFSKKIEYGEQLESKKYISVFPRKRLDKYVPNMRNSELIEEIEFIRSRYPEFEIIGHGLREERSDINDIKFTDNLYDKINVLNNSLFLISPPSGFVEFALCCACSCVIAKTDLISVKNNEERGHSSDFGGWVSFLKKSLNPHNAQILTWIEFVNKDFSYWV